MRRIRNTRPQNRRVARQRTGNMLLNGIGGETLQDRGSQNTAAIHSLNPYYNNNFIGRWQEWTRWYMVSWEARKIVDIPVQDALRVPVELRGLDESIAKKVMDRYRELKFDRQLKRALIQERLLGGSVLLPLYRHLGKQAYNKEFPLIKMPKGCVKGVNVVDVSRLSRPDYSNDPFDETYDRIGHLLIDGTPVAGENATILDGTALFGRPAQNILENFRYNPCGFGESCLTPLYDTLVRATGTQQGAYHLVNLASVLVIAADNLRMLNATGSPAKAKLEELAEQISIYRAAIVDLKGVQIGQHATSFGSVPELVMSFLQILSAGSDIPATRYLGQAPGGLNATGESDLENYYNGINSWQVDHVQRAQSKLIDLAGIDLFGGIDWYTHKAKLELHYPPLWNQSALEKAQTEGTVALTIRTIFDAGLIDQKSALEELKAREIFQTEVEAGEFLAGKINPFEEETENPVTGEKAGKTPLYDKPDSVKPPRVQEKLGGNFKLYENV